MRRQLALGVGLVGAALLGACSAKHHVEASAPVGTTSQSPAQSPGAPPSAPAKPGAKPAPASAHPSASATHHRSTHSSGGSSTRSSHSSSSTTSTGTHHASGNNALGGIGAPGCVSLASDNVLATPITSLPLNRYNTAWKSASNASGRNLHPDFGPSYGEQPVPYGIPWQVVPDSHKKVRVSFDYADESDPGPYPLGSDTPIEGGSGASGDRHALVIDSGTCRLYETYDTHYSSSTSHAGSGAIFTLGSDALRPAGWTSADAAGLPIFPLLLRWDEVRAGHVNHAIRFTVHASDRRYLWPARHQAGSSSDANLPPMGARARLRSTFSLSHYSHNAQVVIKAMQTYGVIVADNGSDWYFGGDASTGWPDSLISELKSIPASAFDFVDESSLMKSANSAAAR
jgi:hypothetical protein